MKKHFVYIAALLASLSCFTACQDDEVNTGQQGGEGTESELPDWYYTGGELGTTFVTTQTAFEQPTPAVDASVTFTSAFNRGEQLFEKPFNSNYSGTRHGLGPVYIRTSCQHCHPGYGHGRASPKARSARTTSGTDTCWLSTTRLPMPTFLGLQVCRRPMP